MSKNSIYYYTSKYVLEQWLVSSKIWATRSVTSNDSMDTIYIAKHLKKFENNLHPKNKIILDKTKEGLYVGKNISFRFFKDLLFHEVATNYKNVSELAHNINLFKLHFDSMDENLNYDSKLNELEFFYELLLVQSNRSYIEDYLQYQNISDEFLHTLPVLPFPFVMCLSYHKDNRFLWDSYTNNKGVCFEFSKEDLKEYLNTTYKMDNYKDLFGDIIYDDNEQWEQLEQLVQLINFDDTLETLILRNHYQLFTFIGTMFKHSYWQPENELRVVFNAKYFNDSRFKIKENYNLKYKNGLKTQDYIEIDIPKSLVKSITIGPLNSGAERKEIENLLIQNNITFINSKGKNIINK